MSTDPKTAGRVRMPEQDAMVGSGIALDIIQVEYSTGPEYPVIHIFGRDREKTALHVQVTGFRPYLYVPHHQADSGPLPLNVTPEEGKTYRSIRGEPLTRLYTVRPGDVRDIRERFTHFEADIPFTTRFMIDTGLTGGVHVPALTASYQDISPADISSSARVCILDIECEDVRGFPEPGRDAVICITCHDSFDNHYTSLIWSPGKKGCDLSGLSGREGLKNGCFSRDRHDIRIFANEREMLAGLAAYLGERIPTSSPGGTSLNSTCNTS